MEPSLRPKEYDANLRSRWFSLGPTVWIATGFGAGLSPFASGTVGALWGLLLTWGLSYTHPAIYAAIVIVLAAVSVPIGSAAARALGGKKDPGAIVLDEIVSMPMTFFLLPFDHWFIIVVGFALNRAFDIVKVPPARQLERLPGGLGIMADDWAAGAYSGLALHALYHLGWLSMT